ncbi:tetratricopeptide repeat protein (macronuclear) [Tetrahymena thermophila SB210]|uniref:Tetratricopeptide repeat protein n=1 Tax=Tetrahymena thermophila (strain SB210) TaxID=312017 RepID=I7M375_TETTS|nr:tetratricopeptide repeat protein [Tetrahymena thermophila SB210]EAS02609.3 tetratricopeptide repeat protein [Tetrahymena thermophila SB210]|eukprot:XP_001022854.3 tetratricopeptide repeat protein [Tetrahymena thermophila SB210]
MSQIDLEQNEGQQIQLQYQRSKDESYEDISKIKMNFLQQQSQDQNRSGDEKIQGNAKIQSQKAPDKRLKQTIFIEDDETNKEQDNQESKITEWPKCEICDFKLFSGICIDANCPKQDQMLLVCLQCHNKEQLRCVTLLDYSEKILFSEEIKELLRYKKSRHLNMLESSQELIHGNANLMCNKLIDTLKYYRKSMERLYDLDKNYQKTNIWRKEQVRQVCLNLEKVKGSYKPQQIQFLEFILGFHKLIIRNFVVKNMRSQQAYDNDTIYLDKTAKNVKPPVGQQGTSAVINLTSPNQSKQNKSDNNKGLLIQGEYVIISENEDVSVDSKSKKGNKLQIIDINESQNQLKELLNPSEDKLKELQEKERQKREKNAKKIKKDLFLEKSSYYQQQLVLKKEKSMDIEEFFKQKEKKQIISEEKTTRSRLKAARNTDQVGGQINKQEFIQNEKNSDQLMQVEQQKPKRGRKKKQQEEVITTSQLQGQGLTYNSDLKQFNQKNNNNNNKTINDYFQTISTTHSKINVKQEEQETKKDDINSESYNNQNPDMDIEYSKYQIQKKYQQVQQKRDSNQDTQKSPTNSSFSKEFVTKIEYDRVPFFRKSDNSDQEEEIDIILDDEDEEEEEGQASGQEFKKQEILNQLKIGEQSIIQLNDQKKQEADKSSKCSNQIQEKENSKLIIEENLNQNEIQNTNSQNCAQNLEASNLEKATNNLEIEEKQNKFQKNLSNKDSQFADDLEDDYYDDQYYNEFKKSPSISNMYAEDSLLSNHKIQLNTRIKRVFYEDYYLGQSSDTEQEENKSNNLDSQNKEEIQQVQMKKSQGKYQYQHFEYLNQYLDDEELTDRIIKTPIKSDAVRLYFNFEGNYTSIQSVKALEEILPKYEQLNELCINLRNCFIWMEIEILGRNLRLLKKLSKLSLNLSKTQIEIQHLFGLVKHLNRISSLQSLNIDLSENVFKGIDNHSLSVIGIEDLQIPEISLHLDDFDLEQDSTQIILNVFCRKNKRLNKLYLVNYGDMNKIHLVNFICFLVKRQRISEVVLRIDITELKKKRLAEIISACQSSQSLVKLGFELTGKISPSVMEEFSLIGENCKSLIQFYMDISDLENDDQQILSFIRSSVNNSKNHNKHHVVNLKQDLIYEPYFLKILNAFNIIQREKSRQRHQRSYFQNTNKKFQNYILNQRVKIKYT